MPVLRVAFYPERVLLSRFDAKIGRCSRFQIDFKEVNGRGIIKMRNLLD
jgi:hypothetical protein